MSREAFALPKYFNTNISVDSSPQSAVEYLFQVRKEAELMPSVYSIANNTEDNDVPEVKEEPVSDKSDDFDEDWVESVVQDFTHIRKMIERKKKEGVVTSTTFPHVNDENGWEYYCFQKRDEKDATEPLKKHCKYPVASELIQLDYITLNTVLNYHYEWMLFDDTPITKDMCVWLYCLLVFVEMPLSSGVCGTIRGIYRRLSEYSIDNEALQSCVDVVKVICSRYFNQKF